MSLTSPALKSCLVLALLALTIPAAEAIAASDLTVATVTASAATGTSGSLAALVMRYNSGEAEVPASPTPRTSLPLPAHGFVLNASYVEVTSLHNDQQVYTTASTVDGDRLEGPYETSQTFHDAHVVAEDIQEEYYLVIRGFGDASVNIHDDCAHAAAANDTDQAVVLLDLREWVEVQPCPGSDVQVTGDFQVKLWQWDGNLTHRGGSVELDSGFTNRQSVFTDPTGNVRGAWISDDVTLTLDVEDGELVLRDYDPPGFGRIYVTTCAIEATELRLQEVSGHLATASDDIPIQAEVLTTSGDLKVTLSRSHIGSQRMSALLQGELRTADADGLPLAIEVANPGGSSSLQAWLLVLTGAVVVPAAVAVWRISSRRMPGIEPSPAARKRAARYFEFAQKFDLQGNHVKALAWVERAVRSDALEPDYHALRAHSLTMMGDDLAALRVHRRLNEMLARDDLDARAWNAFEAAKCAQRLGSKDEAWTWLDTALGIDPSLEDDLRHEPGLLALLGEGRATGRPRQSQ